VTVFSPVRKPSEWRYCYFAGVYLEAMGDIKRQNGK